MTKTIKSGENITTGDNPHKCELLLIKVLDLIPRSMMITASMEAFIL